MILGFSDPSPSPKTNYVHSLGHQNPDICLEHLSNIICIDFKIWEIQKIDSFGKDGHREMMKIRLRVFGNLGYGTNIFLKIRNVFLGISNTYNI